MRDSFDLVQSFIVLQHILPERGYRYIRRLLEKVSDGGIFALHVRFAKRRNLLVHEAPMAKYDSREGNVIQDLVATHEHPVGTVIMFGYGLNEMFATVNEFVTQPMSVRLIPGPRLGICLIGQRSTG